LSAGVLLYVRESHDRGTLEKFGHGTPDDWIETHLYARWSFLGPVLMAFLDVVAFGIGPGGLIFAIQMIWIPFWAAGVINGIGHYWGYRNYPVEDASTNIIPWGILIGGEEFHNNHHAYPSSAKLSSAWYEFDIGWTYIRLLEMLGLARVRRIAPVPVSARGRPSATRIPSKPSSPIATTCLRNTPAQSSTHAGRRSGGSNRRQLLRVERGS